ncbi:MAG: helix-hairpin-helix domain-containing protein [Ignavibacteria bacterium]|nr:helix-hairpin-helix domain-containing protein [Ignavibacteria bacterium]
MRKLFIPIALFLFSVSSSTIAQTDTTSTDIEESLENVLEETTDESEDNFLYDEFENLTKHPIDLNTCSAEDLLQVPILDLSDANLIIEHRKKFGMFISSSELFSVEKLDAEKVRKLLPFVFAEQTSFKNAEIEKPEAVFTSFLRDVNFDYRSRIISDLQPRAGFLDDKYQGNKIKFYNRGIFEFDNTYQLSFLTEKDAGEKSLNDFTSYSLSAKKLGDFSSIVIGDFIIEFGNGLALWSPYASAKSADIGFVTRQRDKNIIPYKSTDENNFFRGAAIQYDWYPLSFSLYASNNYFDASIDSIRNVISSMPIDGYHRTETEYDKKKSAKEQFLGGRVDYSISNSLQLSGLYYTSTYSLPLETSSAAKGKIFSHSSVAYSYLPDGKAGTQSSFIASGEFSFNGISVAQLHSLQKTFSRNFSYVFSVRSYPRNYYSLHGRAFAENPYDLQNEVGIYNGILLNTRFGKISFYYDQFMFPAGTSSTPLSSKGNEMLLSFSTRVLKNLETTIRYKNEKKDVVLTGDEVKEFSERFRQQFRFETIFPVSPKLQLKNRVEYNSYALKKNAYREKGWLFFQDVKYKLQQNISLYGRVIFFKTDSFNSAIYEFENDLPGVMSNLAMYSEGFRWYFLVKVKFLNRFNLSFKYSETTKPKEKSLSSGTSEIFSNFDNNFHLQFDLAL